MLSKHYLEYALRTLFSTPAGELGAVLVLTDSRTSTDVLRIELPCTVTVDAQQGFAIVSCSGRDQSTNSYEADAALVMGGTSIDGRLIVHPTYDIAYVSGLYVKKEATQTDYPLAFHMTLDTGATPFYEGVEVK